MLEAQVAPNQALQTQINGSKWIPNKKCNSLYKLFTCMMCMPTWVGFGLSYLLQSQGVDTPLTMYGIENLYLVMFLDGVLASGGVYTLNVLVEHFEG